MSKARRALGAIAQASLRNVLGRFATRVGAGWILFMLVRAAWPAPFGVVLEGALLGGLLGLSAFGIVLVYRANRVVNFAQADLGVLPASVFIVLLTVRSWSYWTSWAVALVVAIALGALVERVIVRWFANSPRLVLMIATLGLAQLLAGAGSLVPSYKKVFLEVPGQVGGMALSSDGGPLRLGATPFEAPIRDNVVVGSVAFGGNHLVAAVAVVAVALALGVGLKRTRAGLALQATGENAERALLLGISVRRVQSWAWVFATVLSATSLVLRAGVIGLPGTTLFGPGFLLRTLAVALIGRMQNLGVVFVTSAGLGIVEQSMIWQAWGTSQLDLSLAAVVVVLLRMQHRRGSAEDGEALSWRDVPLTRPTPSLESLRVVRVGRWVALAAVAAVVAILPVLLGPGDQFLATLLLILVAAAFSIVVLTGWAGEVSLAPMAVAGLATAIGALLAVEHHVDPLLVVVASAIVGTVGGGLVGCATLGLRGHYVTIATFSVAVAMSNFVLDPDAFSLLPDYRFSLLEPREPVLGRIPLSDDRAFYYFCAVVLVVVYWLADGMRRGRTARALIAVRDNDHAAQSYGIDAERTRVVAYATSGCLAGVAGGLVALHQRQIPAELFWPDEGIRLFAGAVFGGVNSLLGAAVGTVFLRSTTWFNDVFPVQYRSAVASIGSGAGLLAVVMLVPAGIAAPARRLLERLIGRLARRRDLPVPAPLARTARRGNLATRLSTVLHVDLRRHRRPTDFDGSAALRARSLRAGYGSVEILHGVDFEVSEGEIVTILGTNGAGKSTLLRAVAGLLPVTGEVRFGDAELHLLAPHQIARRGVALVPSGRSVFATLTVADNLRLAASMSTSRIDARDRVEKVIGLFPALDSRRKMRSSSLSGGERQQLSLAMALATEPRLLLIDEVSVGLGPGVADWVVEIASQLRDEGVPVVVVEQSVRLARRLSDRVYFLDAGEIRYHGSPGGLIARPDIVRTAILGPTSTGSAADTRAGRKPGRGRRSKKVALQTRALSKGFAGLAAVDDLTIEVRRGEIVALVGPNGAGKSTVLDLVSGFQPPDSGTITLDGRAIDGLPPARRFSLGMSRSFQDGQLFGSLTVHQALMIAIDRRRLVNPFADALRRPGALRGDEVAADRADQLLRSLGVAAHRDHFVAALSPGLRRIVELACLVGRRPGIALLDEPSAGVAEQEIAALGDILLRLRESSNAGILLVEHNWELVRLVADRVVAIDAGRSIATGPPEEVLADAGVLASLGFGAGVTR